MASAPPPPAAAAAAAEPMEPKAEPPPPPPAATAEVPAAGDADPPLPGESVVPSEIDMKGMQEEELTKFQKIRRFMYNPMNGRVLGRTGFSWLQVLIFYIAYYFFVFTYFILWMVVLIESSGKGDGLKPSLTAMSKPVILAGATGLSVFPSAPRTKSAKDPKEATQSSTIYYDLNTTASWTTYSRRLNKTVSSLKDYTVPGGLGECTGPNYGYDVGKPCVLIRFNRVFDWTPKPMKDLEQYLKENYKKSDPAYRDFLQYKESLKSAYPDPAMLKTFMDKNIGIHCMSDGGELEALGNLTYIPEPGIPSENFKKGINRKGWNWTPYIFLQFTNPKRNVFIPVICKAFEENMNLYHSRSGIGAVRFSLFIVGS